MTDHVRGSGGVELTQFADFECPYCRDAAPSLRRVLERMDGRVRLRFRHFPIVKKHPHALRAAYAAEAAGAQGRFWEMHDLLYDHQKALEDADLVGYASELGLDVDRFTTHMEDAATAAAVEEDRSLGETEGVSSTPAFFIDGRRYGGFYDVESLVDELEDAGA
jgi:formate-nitrite transporter family protein